MEFHIGVWTGKYPQVFSCKSCFLSLGDSSSFSTFEPHKMIRRLRFLKSPSFAWLAAKRRANALSSSKEEAFHHVISFLDFGAFCARKVMNMFVYTLLHESMLAYYGKCFWGFRFGWRFPSSWYETLSIYWSLNGQRVTS